MIFLQLYNKLNSILKKFFKLDNVKHLSIEYYKITDYSITPFIAVWINYYIDNRNTKRRNFTFNIDDENLKDKIDKFIEFYEQLQNESANMQ